MAFVQLCLCPGFIPDCPCFVFCMSLFCPCMSLFCLWLYLFCPRSTISCLRRYPWDSSIWKWSRNSINQSTFRLSRENVKIYTLIMWPYWGKTNFMPVCQVPGQILWQKEHGGSIPVKDSRPSCQLCQFLEEISSSLFTNTSSTQLSQTFEKSSSSPIHDRTSSQI